jgi:cobalt-precorrin-7 (C5)-methyltransferase
MAIEKFPVMIVGCGPGALEYLAPAGRAAIEQAEVLVGAPRLLELFPSCCPERIAVGNDLSYVLAAMESHVGRKRVTVLVTGDPGLWSLAKPVIRRFGRSACYVIPGISAVQTAFARIGLNWEDASIISLHGQQPVCSPESLSMRTKIAVLTGGERSRVWLQALNRALNAHEIYVCSNLTLPDEMVERIEPSALETIPLPSRSIILFIEKECLQ